MSTGPGEGPGPGADGAPPAGGARRGRRAPLALLAALVLLTIPLGYPDLCFRVFHPAGDDDLELTVPYALFLRETLRRGELPSWNPYTDAGASAFARFPYLGPCYPTTALFWFLEPGPALNASWVIHLALAGLGALALARRLGLGPAAALAAALAYLHAGAFRGHVGAGYLTAIVASAWLPWLLLLTDPAATEPGRAGTARRSVGAGALVLAAILLGGQPTDAIAVLTLWPLFALGRGVGRDLGRGRERPGSIGGALGTVAARIAATAALGGAIAAVFWWPAIAALLEGGGLAERAPKPEIAGRAADLLAYLRPARGWGGLDGRHLAFPVLAVALAAPLVLRRRDEAGAPGAGIAAGPTLGALTVVTGLLSLGHLTPVWAAVQALVPPLSWLRGTTHFLGPLALFASLLAGHVVGAAGRHRPALATALLLAVAIDAAAYQAPAWSRGRDPSAGLPVGRVREHPIRARLRADADAGAAAGRVLALETRIPERELLFRRNDTMLDGLESVHLSVHFPSRATAELMEALAPLRVDWESFSDDRVRMAGQEPTLVEPRAARLLDLLSVRNLVTTVELPAGAGSGLEEVLAVPPHRLYRRTTALPRARLVATDPTRGALAPGEPGWQALPPGCLAEATSPSERATGDVSITARAPGRLALRVETPAAAWLVASEHAGRGWRATVDGAPTPPGRTRCGGQVALAVGAGTHEVTLRYVPPGRAAGAALGGAALVAAVALALGGRGRRAT